MEGKNEPSPCPPPLGDVRNLLICWTASQYPATLMFSKAQRWNQPVSKTGDVVYLI